jgi:CheY-like chemotaxis protein
MTEPERVIVLLLEIETETAGFYEGLARRADEPPELRALWLSLAKEEHQHAAWVRRLQGSRLTAGVLASFSAPPMAALEAALGQIRRHREEIERGRGSSADALAVAIGLEASEASRALADIVAAIPSEHDPGPFLPAPAAHLGRLGLAANRLGLVELAETARALVPRTEAGWVSPRRVLIVDDDPDMVDTCARILRGSGHDCLTATSGLEALALLPSHRPDLILADLRMPEMDGLALLTQARRLAPEIPVIIVTAYGSMETARQAQEAGAAAYLTKPFGLSELRDVVTRVLSGSPARAGTSGPAAGVGPTPPGPRHGTV